MRKTTILGVILAASLLCGCKNSPESSSSSAGVSLDITDTSEPKADIYAQAALAAAEFPTMVKMSDNEIDAYLGFDMENYADYAFYMNLMSSNLNRVLVALPANGCHDAVYEEFLEYFDKLSASGAAYPQQEQSVAGAVIGETVDGYIYIIFHSDGETAAQALEAV